MMRVREPEELDQASDAEAARNLADIARINHLTAARRKLMSLIGQHFQANESFRFLDVGAASGDFARSLSSSYPLARTICLDLQYRNLAAAPPLRIQGDAFRLPFANRALEAVHCSLFLHHFSEEDCVLILREMARVSSRLVLVQDLHRHQIPYWFLPVTRPIFRWQPITVADGQRSVAAGWRRAELQDLLGRAGLKGEIRWHFPSFRYFIAIQT